MVNSMSSTGGIGLPPRGARIVLGDPNGKWVIFEDGTGSRKIQFDVNEATNLARGPLGPGTGSAQTGAFVGPDGKVVVVEGMHRLEAAKGGTVILRKLAVCLVCLDGSSMTFGPNDRVRFSTEWLYD
jgi:hypothetical protein